MGNGGEDGELHNQDEDSATNRDENLAHDDVSDILVRGTEMDHETEGEDVNRDSEIESPLIVAGLADEETDDEEKHAGNNLESRVDISSLGRLKVDNDLQEGGKEVVPGVVGDLVSQIDHAGGDNGSVKEESALEERHRGKPVLPDTEEDESTEANDDHGDDVAGAPTVRGVSGKVERKKEDDETTTKEQNSDNCIVVSIRGMATGRR